MKEKGIVIKAKDDKVKVKIERRSACDRCEQSCGLAGDSNSQQAMYLEVANTVQAEPGDEVWLDMGEKEIRGAAFLVYGFPILALILGYFVFSMLGSAVLGYSAEPAGMVGALVFLGLAFFVINRVDFFLQSKSEFQPRLVSSSSTERSSGRPEDTNQQPGTGDR